MSKQINLTKDPIWDLLRKVTIPASVGSLFQTFYNLVDTWFAGRISAEAIGAIAKSFPIYFVIIAVGVGIGAATNACIGNLLGEKKINKASLFIAQSVVFAIITSVIVTLFGLNVSNFLLGVMGSDATSIRDKLTPNLLYTCRGIYLVLLYKNIADVYISYYNQCDARMTVIDGTTRYCSSSAIDDINTLIDSFLISSIDKIFLFAHNTTKEKRFIFSGGVAMNSVAINKLSKLENIIKDKIAEIETNKEVIISEFLSPIYFPNS